MMIKLGRSGWLVVLALALVGLALGEAPAQAQTPDLDLSWWTVDGGGGTSSGGDYGLSGTAGQPDAGTLSGGEFSLAGGLWKGGQASSSLYQVYLPIVVR